MAGAAVTAEMSESLFSEEATAVAASAAATAAMLPSDQAGIETASVAAAAADAAAVTAGAAALTAAAASTDDAAAENRMLDSGLPSAAAPATAAAAAAVAMPDERAGAPSGMAVVDGAGHGYCDHSDADADSMPFESVPLQAANVFMHNLLLKAMRTTNYVLGCSRRRCSRWA